MHVKSRLLSPPSVCTDSKQRDFKKDNNLNKNIKSERVMRDRDGGGRLTLDVDGDAGLLAVGDCLVGGLTDDLLTRLDVGRR